MAKSEHSRPQVLAAGDPHGYQGGVLPRGPILYAVSLCTDDGFGIEMVQALDEAYAVDIVQALQPGAISKAGDLAERQEQVPASGTGWTPWSRP